MKTSAPGRALIAAREGRRLRAYRDSVGVWTIGIGHTGRMAPPRVTPGMMIDAAQCDAFLAADLAPVEAALDATLKVRVTQNQFDALASLIFNVGTGYAKPSMAIIARLNAGDIRSAADGFGLFHRPAAIIHRRNAEKAQFLTPDPPAVGRLPPIAPAPAPAGFAPIPIARPDGGASPAPASVFQTATHTKGKPSMTSTIVSEAEKAGVDAIAGLTNFFGNIGAQLTAGSSIVKAGVTETASGTPIPASASSALGEVEAAVTEIEAIVADARAGKWSNEVSDVLDLLTTGMAILARFGVSVPGLSQFTSLIPMIEAIA